MPDSFITFTPNLHLTKLPANYRVWAQIMNDNLTLVDASINGFVQFSNLRGPWANSTVYAVGDTVVDPLTAVLHTALTAHTSALIPTTFAEDALAHPSYWTLANAPATSRGAWTGPGTAYNVNDFVLADGMKYAMCLIQHVSQSTFNADFALGRWSVLIDLSIAGSLLLPILSGPVDALKFVNTNLTGTAYEIIPGTEAMNRLGGILPVVKGGTGTNTSTGSVSVVLNNLPTINSPTITNATLTGATTLTGALTGTTATFSGNVSVGATSNYGWTGRTILTAQGDGLFTILNNAQTTGARLDPTSIPGTLAITTSGGGAINLTVGGSASVLTAGTGNFISAVKAYSTSGIPAGGTLGAGYMFSSTANFGINFGSGAPTAAMARGSLYLRSDGAPQFNNDGTASGWIPLGGIVAVSTTAPSSPVDGQLWYNSDASVGGGDLYIRYNDGVGASQWVPASPGVSGGVLQTVSFETGAVATGTTIIPVDDTIPQITEGDQYMTLAITPRNATSRLIIEVVCSLTSDVAGTSTLSAALFQDSTANALAAGWQRQSTAGLAQMINFTHIMTSGTTSATTFRVRGGPSAAGTTTFNGASAARIFGGVMASSIVISEVL